MKYQRKPLFLDAIKLTEKTTVGDTEGKPGDYLVTMNGKISIQDKEFFENHFIPYVEPEQSKVAEPVQEPQQEGKYKPWETKPNANKICISCNEEKPPEQVDRNTGQCVDCLKMETTCETCGAAIMQLDKIGTICRKCLQKKKVRL